MRRARARRRLHAAVSGAAGHAQRSADPSGAPRLAEAGGSRSAFALVSRLPSSGVYLPSANALTAAGVRTLSRGCSDREKKRVKAEAEGSKSGGAASQDGKAQPKPRAVTRPPTNTSCRALLDNLSAFCISSARRADSLIGAVGHLLLSPVICPSAGRVSFEAEIRERVTASDVGGRHATEKRHWSDRMRSESEACVVRLCKGR